MFKNNVYVSKQKNLVCIELWPLGQCARQNTLVVGS